MSELRRLHLLVELSRHGTIAAVAESTSFSTSGISQQLAALERDIGTPLLQRDGRRLQPTPAGAALIAEAPGLLDAWERARSRALAATTTISGTLRIGVFQTGLLTLIPAMLDTLHTAHPDLELQVLHAEPENAIPAVRARELDAAIIESYPPESAPHHADLHHESLGSDPMLLAVPKHLSATTQGLSDLHDAPWVFETAGSPVRRWAEQLCQQAGFEPRVQFQASDVFTQLELVRQGRAAAFVPALTPAHHRDDIPTIELPGQDRALQFVCRASVRHAPSIGAVYEALHSAARETAIAGPRPTQP